MAYQWCDDAMRAQVRPDAAIDGVLPDTEEGFTAWVSPHLTVLRVLADRQVGPAAGADVVQEALLRAWQRRDTFDPDRGTVRAWLVAILLDRARRHRLRRPLPLPKVGAGVVQAPSADRIDVERAVARLPRRQRQVITLYYLADLSVAEVAAALGVSESSVKTHLGAARSALRAWLEIA